MTAASKTRRFIACVGAFLMIAFGVAFIIGAGTAHQAQAQSSVRPPANAVTPGPTKGRVPGEVKPGKSDSDMWRRVRKGVFGTVSIPDKQAGQLVQSEGDNWRALKNGPIATWGALAMLAIVVLLGLFYLLRGKIRVEHGLSGRTVTRFADLERIGHWLLAVSFLILAVTGLNITYGKYVVLPVIGKAAFSGLAAAGKWLHNYVAFAFMAGLVMVFVLWIKDNFPSTRDLTWLAKGGGLFVKGVHPPSKKFNAGQKIIFWLVVLGGLSLTLSGIALLFPFQTAMFAKTFAILNVFGFNLPAELTPLEEMQYAATWHAIVALFMIVVILAHIYIGTIGMEGAFDAMGSGEVDQNWAKEHHSIWAEEAIAAAAGKTTKRPKGKTAPAAAE